MSGPERDDRTGRTAPEESAAWQVREIAAGYLDRAGGDPGVALLAAVQDGIAVSGLVSRGFARWGAPPRGKRR